MTSLRSWLRARRLAAIRRRATRAWLAAAPRDVVAGALTEWLYSEWDDGAECGKAADAVLAALTDAGYAVAPTEPLPEWRCPACGAVTRARMAD